MDPDPALARRMLHASICAYNITGDSDGDQPVQGANRVVKSAAGYSYSVVNAYQREVGFAEPPEDHDPAFFADGEHDINAALAGLTFDGYAVIALRGTLPPGIHGDDLLQWVDDWTNDARIGPVDWMLGQNRAGKAERGFAGASLKLWDWVKDQIVALKDKAPAGILVTGHSKGGAMCYLIASLIRAEWPDLAGKISVHAFAPAVSVDADFIAAYDAMGLGARTTRYIVAQDIVPFLPNWTAASIWTGLHFEGIWHEAEWRAIGAFVSHETAGGYGAPGNLVYFDVRKTPVTTPDALEQALAAVIDALKDGKFGVIGAAHSITDSYAPCFPPLAAGPALPSPTG